MLREWHDFYLLVGTAAATLIGLIFVAISFGANVKAEERQRADVNAWVTPSLVYLVEVFVIAGAAVAPIDPWWLGVLLCGVLVFNLPFGLWRLRYLFSQHREEAIPGLTWLWQSLLPSLAQLVLGAGALGLLRLDARSVSPIAIAVVVLLLCAVRNAWTLVIYLLSQRAS
jgi:hypothetical protein